MDCARQQGYRTVKTTLRGRDFISTQEWTKEELETVLHLAFDLKMKWGLYLPTRLLEDKALFMLFFFSSTRTRNSFEAGMTRLGGHAIFLEPDKMQDRKSTRLNSSHPSISYAVFCLKKKKKNKEHNSNVK